LAGAWHTDSYLHFDKKGKSGGGNLGIPGTTGEISGVKGYKKGGGGYKNTKNEEKRKKAGVEQKTCLRIG